jgi:hypothetical protein
MWSCWRDTDARSPQVAMWSCSRETDARRVAMWSCSRITDARRSRIDPHALQGNVHRLVVAAAGGMGSIM